MGSAYFAVQRDAAILRLRYIIVVVDSEKLSRQDAVFVFQEDNDGRAVTHFTRCRQEATCVCVEDESLPYVANLCIGCRRFSNLQVVVGEYYLSFASNCQ